jgi:hypothetical protein
MKRAMKAARQKRPASNKLESLLAITRLPSGLTVVPMISVFDKTMVATVTAGNVAQRERARS